MVNLCFITDSGIDILISEECPYFSHYPVKSYGDIATGSKRRINIVIDFQVLLSGITSFSVTNTTAKPRNWATLDSGPASI